MRCPNEYLAVKSGAWIESLSCAERIRFADLHLRPRLVADDTRSAQSAANRSAASRIIVSTIRAGAQGTTARAGL